MPSPSRATEGTCGPRAIEGTIGSRIRVILGATGNDWLLILNHDDGHCQWQTHHWSGHIPYAVADWLNHCSTNHINCSEIDFGPAVVDPYSYPSYQKMEAWYINGVEEVGPGSYCWRGGMSDELSSQVDQIASLPSSPKVSFGERHGYPSLCLISGNKACSFNNVDTNLIQRVTSCISLGTQICLVRLFNYGGYYIQYEDGSDYGSDWKGIGMYLEKELEEARERIEDVARAGNFCWLVICPNHFIASAGISAILTRELSQFYTQQRSREQRNRQEINDYFNKIENEKLAAEQSAKELAAKKKTEEGVKADIKQCAKEKEDDTCVVCWENVATRAVVPCGHMCLCEECASNVSSLPREKKLCPLCRTPIQSAVRIYIGCS